MEKLGGASTLGEVREKERGATFTRGISKRGGITSTDLVGKKFSTKRKKTNQRRYLGSSAGGCTRKRKGKEKCSAPSRDGRKKGTANPKTGRRFLNPIPIQGKKSEI